MMRHCHRQGITLLALLLIDCVSVGADPCAASGQALLPLSDVKACLDTFRISGELAYHTLASVEHGVLDLYSFERIAADSTASKQALQGGCKMKVHEVKVDLRGRIDDLRRWVMQQLGLDESLPSEALLDDVNKDRTVPAAPFHQELGQLFRSLHDAHTLYIEPWASNFEAFQYYHVGPIGRSALARIRVRPPAQTDGTPVVELEDAAGKWSRVEAVGEGVEPFMWLTDQADELEGNYKSLGARVNAYLSSWGSGIFPLMGMGLPAHNEVEFLLQGGQRTRLQVWVKPESSWLSRTNFDQTMNTSVGNGWALTHKWLHAHLMMDDTKRQQAMQLVADEIMKFPEEAPLFDPATDVSIHPDLPAGHSRQDKKPGWQPHREYREPLQQLHKLYQLQQSVKVQDPEEVEIMRRLGEDVTEIGRHPPSTDTRWPQFIAYNLPSKKAVVLKVTTFMPLVSLQDPTQFLTYWLGGLTTLYDQIVNQASADRLILDLSDNGGGVVELANLLVMLIAPRLDTPEKLCSVYAARLEEFWRDWLKSFGGKWDDVVKSAKERTGAELEGLVTRLVDLGLLERSLGTYAAPVPLDLNKLRRLLAEVKNLPDKDKRDRIVRALEERTAFVPETIRQLLTGKEMKEGWYPFTGDVVDPSNGKPFDPPMKPYFDQVQHQWGPTSNAYSSRFLMACTWPFDNGLDFLLWMNSRSITAAKHQWKELAVLTNGQCGSACSAVATKLQMAEGATVFTYGGVPGERMDVSAFAGGNVEDYGAFWPRVLYATLIGDVIYGPSTPIGKRLRQPGPRERNEAHTLLLPLPSQATTRFNFNMLFMREFGPEALPREWYVVPAHKQYQEWHVTSPVDMTTWPNLFGLYKKISEEDWAGLRNNPEWGSDFSMSCAAKPPTEPYRKPWDWGIYIYPPIILAVIVCCGCCAGCCYACLLCGRHLGLCPKPDPPAREFVEAEGVELGTASSTTLH